MVYSMKKLVYLSNLIRLKQLPTVHYCSGHLSNILTGNNEVFILVILGPEFQGSHLFDPETENRAYVIRR